MVKIISSSYGKVVIKCSKKSLVSIQDTPADGGEEKGEQEKKTTTTMLHNTTEIYVYSFEPGFPELDVCSYNFVNRL